MTIGLDPGFRTGVKVAVVDATGKEDAVSALYVDGNLIGEVMGHAIAMDWDVEKAGVYAAVNYIGLLDELIQISRWRRLHRDHAIVQRHPAQRAMIAR